MSKRLTTSEFIKKILKEIGIELTIAGVYKNMNTPMLFRNKYGVVKKSLTELKRGRGISIKAATDKTSYIVNMFKEIHKDKYNYSLVDYKSSHSNVKVICPKHGEFEQKTYTHLAGFGCKKCYVEGIQSNTKEFIKKATKTHGEKYDYSLVDYKNAKTKVKIICKKHGEFEQRPDGHLGGLSCGKCGIISQIEKLSSTTEEFVSKSTEIHGERYDYSKTEYTHSNIKVKIICKEHGEFEQIPRSHLKGSGCSGCAKKGFDALKPATLYYIKYKDFYKIGITNLSIKERYGKTKMKDITILKEIYFENGADALKEETRIKRENKEFLYNKLNNLTNTISKEMYTKDIINKTMYNGKL